MSNDALDYVRIRRLAALRRSQHRSAQFMMGLAGLCVVMACAAINESINLFRSGQTTSALLFVISTPLLAWLARVAWKRRRRILEQIESTKLNSAGGGFPLTPPDFTTLQDGSQVAESLRDMVD